MSRILVRIFNYHFGNYINNLAYSNGVTSISIFPSSAYFPLDQWACGGVGKTYTAVNNAHESAADDKRAPYCDLNLFDLDLLPASMTFAALKHASEKTEVERHVDNQQSAP